MYQEGGGTKYIFIQTKEVDELDNDGNNYLT